MIRIIRSSDESNRSNHAIRFVLASLVLKSFAVLAGLFCSCPVLAADNEPSELDYPLAVINAASVDRLRANAGAMFETAERQDMTDRVDQWMTSSLQETKGIDRTRPFGIMMFLRPELFAPPIGISYLPVSNLDEALQTISGGIATVSPVEGKPDRHEIHYTENFKLRTFYRKNYLFLVGPDGNDTSLDRDFPDPEALTARLTNQYDISAALMLKSIPPGMKTLLLTYFRNQWQADLQQRDDEPESVYRLRRTNGEFWGDLLEQIVNQGNEIALGARLDPEQKSAFIELDVAGTRDSKLAKFFQKMTGKRSFFGNLLGRPATVTTSLSLQLDQNQRKLVAAYINALRKDSLAKFDDEIEKSDFLKIADPLFKNLQQTAETGHLDLFAQLLGTERGQFTILGGVKLSTSNEMPDRLQDLIEFLADGDADNGMLNKFEFEIDSINSLPVHRVPIQPDQEGGKRMFGENAFLHVYATPQALWGAFGNEDAAQVLREAVEGVAQPSDPSEDRNRVPLRFVMHANNWLALVDENQESDRFDKLSHSFASDNDAMVLEIRPTDTGVRIRTEFQSGFISLMGRNFAEGIEKGFFQGPRGQRRNGQRGPNDQKPSEPTDDDFPGN